MNSHLRSIITAGLATVLLAGCATSEPAATTSMPAPLVSLQLGEDGLGDVLLGSPPETVVADISALYGEPDLDSDWIASEPNIYGSCPGDQMRAIGWGSLLTIFVKDGNEDLGGRFFTYTYGYDYTQNVGGVDPRGLGLSTSEGIGIGSTVADLEAAYLGSAAIAGDVELDVWSFQIDDSTIGGLLDGPDAASTVTLIELADGC
ncbi:MAG: hypothetical protein GY788_24650 [bacterium]|nr:hypothetical protein [bacterium]